MRFLRDRGIEAYGFDQGEYVDHACARGIQHLTLSEMTGQRGSFNVVSLIEVLEHIPDPLSLLRTVRELLRPGGLLFLTTGNVDPHCRVFASWEYVVPEVHVSYFSPKSLRQALDRAGLVASPLGKTPGVTNIIKYKILKNLGLKSVTPLFRILPWFAYLSSSRPAISNISYADCDSTARITTLSPRVELAFVPSISFGRSMRKRAHKQVLH